MDRDTLLLLCVGALVLAACAQPPGYWTLVDPTGKCTGPAWDVQAWAEEAIAVTGDLSGALADGGTVEIVVGLNAAGYGVPGHITLSERPQYLDAFRSALAHEMGHVGLLRDHTKNCSDAEANTAAAAIILRMKARLGVP